MKRLKANGASLVSDFHRASLKMAWLRLRRVTNESTEIENCYSSLNRELRWLWDSVYFQNPKFQASSHLLWQYSPVCVGPGRITPKTAFFTTRLKCTFSLSEQKTLHKNSLIMEKITV